MKNPFKKEKDNTGLIILGVGAALVAAGAAYLYLTESGENARRAISRRITSKAKDLAAGAISKKIGISKKTVRRVAHHVAN